MTDLRDLGLSSYEDRAYRSMLGLGPVSAMELAEASGVPEGRIYDVLDSLETRGLVRAQTHSRPKQYLAVEPAVAIDRLVETRSRELRAEIDRYEVLGDQLVEELSAETTVDERFLTTAIGTADATELLLERIEMADEEVVMVADVFTSEFDVAEMGPNVLDHVELCFEVTNPMEPDAVVGLLNVKDPSFALELESQFRKHWEQAERYDPGDDPSGSH
ncbi:TrmB family transcriptional regulator [Halorhabdus sp. CUG00001]|uniref:TrmB family transcriptional regulator n=1 Tax=Halorhabdus sp. CUG00001 TaxID=2600297 RepID=UPI00131C6234|nr:helix-turn-helix domain-containing protein [Halorhabdus sp. CUG00001]